MVFLTSWQALRKPALIALCLYVGALLYQHMHIIFAPVPLDLYEGTMLLITGIIAQGDNPYTLAFQPYAADVYPPLYNILVAPLSHVFGNTFVLHRSVCAVFIVMACALLGCVGAKRSGSLLSGLGVAAMMYAALLFYATPVSSTNALGVFLFLATLCVPWLRGFSTASLLLAAVLATLSFYSKQYFVLSMPILCLYLFLFVSKSRAVALGVVFSSMLASSLTVVHLSSPYYLDNTLFAPSAAIQDLQMPEILYLQLKQFFWVYAGLMLAALVAYIGRGSLEPRPYENRGLKWCLYQWHQPLLNKPVDFFAFALVISSMAIVLWLGRNPGNYMTYLFQLMSPFLLVFCFTWIARCSKWRLVIAILLGWSVFQTWFILHRDFTVNLDNWSEVEKVIAASDEVLATQMLIELQLRHDKPVFQDGHSFYFPQAANKPSYFVKELEQESVQGIWQNYMTELYEKVERKEFDAVLISPWEMRGIFVNNPPVDGSGDGKAFLKRHYYREKTIPLSMTHRHGGGEWDIQIWRPRTERSDITQALP